MLARMQNPTLFTHGFRVRHRGREKAIRGQPPIKTRPVIMPVTGMRQTPWNDGVFLTPLVFVAAFAFFGFGTDANTSFGLGDWTISLDDVLVSEFQFGSISVCSW